MALGILKIIFVVLTMAAGAGLILLYMDKSQKLSLAFIINVLLGILFSWINFTSLPSNAALQRGISLAWATLAIFALALRLLKKDTAVQSKAILAGAIVGGVVQMLT